MPFISSSEAKNTYFMSGEATNEIYIFSLHEIHSKNLNILYIYIYKTVLTSGNFCCLLITFANSLDPDQIRQSVSPDLGPYCFTLRVLLREIF